MHDDHGLCQAQRGFVVIRQQLVIGYRCCPPATDYSAEVLDVFFFHVLQDGPLGADHFSFAKDSMSPIG